MRGDGGAAMSAAADVRPARRAERETLSYEQYLLEVISRECEQRRKSKVQRLLKDSALPLEKSLQNFDLKRLPAKAARQLRTLLDGSFLDRKENVLVFGNPGSGKSHLLRNTRLRALFSATCKKRFWTIFTEGGSASSSP